MKTSYVKKHLAVAVILLFIGVSVIPSTGTVVEQSSLPTIRGGTLYVGGDGPGNYSKIQDAIDNASDGDTVFVYDDSSPYYENVVVDKSITLIGEDRDTTIIDCKFHHSIVITVTADSVVICRFTITNAGAVGIYLERSDNNKIYENKISKSEYGIYLDYCEGNEIYSNTIHSNFEEGIMLSHSHLNLIHHNTISNQGYGINLQKSDKNSICYNEIFKHVHHPSDYPNAWGIIIEESNLNNIAYNNLHDNKFHLFCEDSNENNISHNIFSNNTLGIYLWDSFSNVINYNNFLGSCTWFRLHFLFVPKINFPNNWNHNYWGKPRTLPKPILGYMTVFGFLWANFDWHPAQEPYDIGV